MTRIYKIGNLGFVHLSKCAGTSIAVFIENHMQNEISVVDIPDTVGHVTPWRTRHYWHDSKLQTMVFVREPLAWLVSTWKYWTKYPNIRADAMRALNNPFCYWGITFSKRLLNIIHEGDIDKTFVYWYHHDRYLLYDLYGAFTSSATYVGKVEYLADDFFSFLSKANKKDYSIQRALFQDFERQNVSDVKVPEINANLLKEFYNVNKQLYERFGYEQA